MECSGRRRLNSQLGSERSLVCFEVRKFKASALSSALAVQQPLVLKAVQLIIDGGGLLPDSQVNQALKLNPDLCDQPDVAEDQSS